MFSPNKFFMSFFTLSIFTTAIFLASSQTIAKTIVVDQNGNGDHTSIQDAINSANDIVEDDVEIDIIKINPGVYSEIITIDRPVSLIGFGPDFTKLTKYIHVNFSNKDISKRITISSLSVSNQHQYAGIYLANEYLDVVIKNCIIDGCLSGISIYNYDHITARILNNTIVNNSDYGIKVYGHSSISEKKYRYLYIEGNIIAYNSIHGIYFKDYNGSLCRLLDFNNFYSNKDSNITWENSNYFDSSCKSHGSNSQFVYPKFINKEEAKYALQQDSGCKNKGLIGSSNIDPDGTRGDIGAYSGPDSISFWPYPVEGPIVNELSVTPVSVPKGGKITINAKGIIR